MQRTANNTPSLEHLIESEDLGLEVLHPGGVAITLELACLCHVGRDTWVLDVACGTGESSCRLASESAAQLAGLDFSHKMLTRARSKSERRGLSIHWIRGDAHLLPFDSASFDVVICECALCHLDKLKTVREMCRVVRPGGYLGMHDLCWRPHTPDKLRRRLQELEEEDPETAEGWLGLMSEAGLAEVELLDRSDVLTAWTRETHAQLGMLGYLRVLLKVLHRWGAGGLRRVLASERLFADRHLGYVIVVGRVPQ